MALRVNIDKIKTYMQDNDVGVIELAARSNVGQATIYNYLNGRIGFESKTIDKLADAMGVSAFDLILDGDNDNSK